MLKLKLQYFGYQMQRSDSLEKMLMLGKIEDRKRRGRQDEVVGWLHWPNGHEFEQAQGDSEGQGSLACCSPWGRTESTEQHIHISIITAKTWKEPTCPLTDERLSKIWYIPTMECYSALKRKEILQYATTWMNFGDIMLSEVNHSEKDKYCMVPLRQGT